MAESDSEEVLMQIQIEEDKILLLFPCAIVWMALKAEQARGLALTLWRLARDLDRQQREGARHRE